MPFEVLWKPFGLVFFVRDKTCFHGEPELPKKPPHSLQMEALDGREQVHKSIPVQLSRPLTKLSHPVRFRHFVECVEGLETAPIRLTRSQTQILNCILSEERI